MTKLTLLDGEKIVASACPVVMVTGTNESIEGKIFVSNLRAVFEYQEAPPAKKERDGQKCCFISWNSRKYREIPHMSVCDITLPSVAKWKTRGSTSRIYHRMLLVVTCKNTRRVMFQANDVSKEVLVNLATCWRNECLAYKPRPLGVGDNPTRSFLPKPNKLATANSFDRLQIYVKGTPTPTRQVSLEEHLSIDDKSSYVGGFQDLGATTDNKLNASMMKNTDDKTSPMMLSLADTGLCCRKELKIANYTNFVRICAADVDSTCLHKVWANTLARTGSSSYMLPPILGASRTRGKLFAPIHSAMRTEEASGMFVDGRFPTLSYYLNVSKTCLVTSGILATNNPKGRISRSIITDQDKYRRNVFPQPVAELVLPDQSSGDVSYITLATYLPLARKVAKSYGRMTALLSSIRIWSEDQSDEKSSTKTANLWNMKSKIVRIGRRRDGRLKKGQFYGILEETKWLNYMKQFLHISNEVATILLYNTTVLMESFPNHECVVASIVKLMIDPFYRTISGFWHLVVEEWVSKGYDFSQELQYSKGSAPEINPSFIMFLDSAHQLHLQNPAEFEFNCGFLAAVAECSMCGVFSMFGVALSNKQVNDSVHEPIDPFLMMPFWQKFLNPVFNASQEACVLFANCYVSSLELWDDFFFRWDESWSEVFEQQVMLDQIRRRMMLSTCTADASLGQDGSVREKITKSSTWHCPHRGRDQMMMDDLQTYDTRYLLSNIISTVDRSPSSER